MSQLKDKKKGNQPIFTKNKNMMLKRDNIKNKDI